MPDMEKPGSPQVPAGRDKQRASLVRLGIVVGLPLLTVILGLPIWFALVLLLGLAAFVFLPQYLSDRSTPDPKKEWTMLMSNYVRLQSACDALKESPADAEARKRFSMLEQRCRSLLDSHADSDWGQDSAYAGKLRNEIAEMSASVRANGVNHTPMTGQEVRPPAEAAEQVPASASGAAAVPPRIPTPPPRTEVPTPAMAQGLVPAGASAVLPFDTSPALSVKPKAPTPSGRQIPVPATEGKAEQPDAGLASPATTGIVSPAGKQDTARVSEANAVRHDSPARSDKPEVVASAEMPIPALASTDATARTAPAVNPEVPTRAEQQLPASAGEAAAVQPESPAPPAGPEAPAVRRLIPYIWLPGGVEDAAAFYVSVFKNSRIVRVSRFPEGSRAKTWSVMTATICLDGQDLMLLNGGLVYKPPETFQLLVRCADQAEVDHYWERLREGGGEEGAGGWLKDRFGVSWQVMPDALMALLNDPDPQRTARATKAMLKMKKIDIAALRAAVDLR